MSFAIDDFGIKMNNVYALSKNDETKQEKKISNLSRCVSRHRYLLK